MAAAPRWALVSKACLDRFRPIGRLRGLGDSASGEPLAQGIEVHEQRRFLLIHSCEFGRTFYFSLPYLY
jgi:hypothetical protein